MRYTSIITLILAVNLLAISGAVAEIKAPEGSIVARNVDRAAEEAFRTWIGKLKDAPRTEGIRNIGILPLEGDTRDFTALLKNSLSLNRNYRVVILSGKEWEVIEDELARTDPDSGMGDIIDKSTIQWERYRERYVLPETAQGTDAILLGRVRGVDTDWLRARARFALYLVRVDTREQVGGGIAEGESYMPVLDLIIYYKLIVAISLIALIVLIVLIVIIKPLIRSGRRPR